MRGAILQCDEVMEQLQPRFGRYGEMIRRLFAGSGETIGFDEFDCRQGEYPAEPGDYDFFVTTGSQASAYDPEPWILRLIEFVRHLDAGGHVLLGICFGHQIIAMAGHGRVERSARGWGIGVARNRILATPEWLDPVPAELEMLVSHQDQVVATSGDPLVIAGSDFCPLFMVQWNHHFLSVQGHPEWDAGYARALIGERRHLLPTERVEAALRSLQQPPDNTLFAHWALRFIRSR
ncbi:MAG TPA: GMP synthase [Sedimenticola thiotaurini]|uniref:GMP synthase n=1 Tax=Sedimenticola thiotaurini TaxID=1543721 RepID=A0A831W876_9GAMM|nr:GMP synthase [Sedimenticola thiotaurini]